MRTYDVAVAVEVLESIKDMPATDELIDNMLGVNTNLK